MSIIPLSKAYWCENCIAVIDSPNGCPNCATRHNIMPLAKWIISTQENQREVQAVVGTRHHPG